MESMTVSGRQYKNDPVRAQREKVRTMVSYGIRSGTALFGLATTLLIVGLLVGLNGVVTALVLACIILGSVALAPALVFHYGVKAADREDRAAGRQ
jgi:hypothetical protein